MNGSRATEVHGLRRKKRAPCFTCMKCRYSSNRQYNILRHEHRIHTAPKRAPQCCEIKFESKADYYVHCEEVHPGKRLNLTSQKKYGIRAGSVVTESTDDAEASVANSERYPQTRYMLRSLMRPSKDTGLAENTLASVKGTNVQQSLKKSFDKTSGYWTKDFSSTNSFALSLEASNDERHSNPDYTRNNEETLSNDSHCDCSESLSYDVKCNNESQMVINEKPVTVFAEPNVDKNFYCHPSRSPKEKSVYPSGKDSMLSGSTTSDCEERNSSSDPGTDILKSSFDSGVPITSTPSNLPLKKRILRDLALENRENIEKSRKPVGDRLYRRPIQLETEMEQISKQCRQSRKERQSLGKKMVASKLFSIHNEAENVPSVVKITYNGEAQPLDFNRCKEVTSRHMDFLSSIDIGIFKRHNEALTALREKVFNFEN